MGPEKSEFALWKSNPGIPLKGHISWQQSVNRRSKARRVRLPGASSGM